MHSLCSIRNRTYKNINTLFIVLKSLKKTPRSSNSRNGLTCDTTSRCRQCFGVPLTRSLCLGTLAAFRVLLLVVLFWEIPLGGTGPVVHIEIPPVLSKEWDNRDRRQESQRLAWQLAEWHDTLGQWGKGVDIMATVGGRSVGMDSDFSRPKEGPD